MTGEVIHLVDYKPNTRKAILIVALCGAEDGLKMSDYPERVTCPDCLKLMKEKVTK